MTTTEKRPTTKIDETTARLLNEMQDNYPLVERPYAELGARIGISEDDAVARVREARAAGLIRQICGIYDTKTLGYSSALVATKVAADRLAHAAKVVNAHPGVSHNYRRNHEFNMWYTIAMPPGHDLSAVIERLCQLSGAESMREMPTLRLFKIGVTLDIAGERPADARGTPEYSEEKRKKAVGQAISERDVAYICATQGNLQDIATPFEPIAQELGWTVDEVLGYGRAMIERGVLRRFAAIVNHREAGFRANGMAVWNVPAERVEEFGQFVAGYRNVSHCYQRPTYPDWPYNVFSMIHAPRVDGVEAVAQAIADETGITDHRVLYSSDEFKKIRLPYYIPEYDQWEALCEAAAREDA